MKTQDCVNWLAVPLFAAAIAFSGAAQAASGNYSSAADLGPIVEMIEQEDYETAINALFDQLDLDPDNADILSLLGFSYRKIKAYEDALNFYQMALRVEPKHKGANEYLGELYLETDQFDKAVQQLDILDDLCTFGCKEYSTLKRAIDSYRQASSNSS